MSRWTKKHYIIMGTALSNIKTNDILIEAIAIVFKDDNKLFDKNMFEYYIKILGKR